MSKGYVVLDSTWARLLGVRRSGGKYRIGRRELTERLKLQQAPMEEVLSPLVLQGGRGLTANGSPLDDTVTAEPQSHFIEFYETEAFPIDSIRDFLVAGLVTGDAAIVVATDAHRDSFDRALIESGIDLPETRQCGRFVSLDTSEAFATFMVDGMPDAARFRATMGQFVSRALENAPQVRIYDEMAAVLWDQRNVAAAITLEDFWNDLATRYPFSLFCAHPIHAFDTDAITADFRNAAGCLLERALIRDSYSAATALAVIPLLRRIAEATGALKDLVVLAAALRKVDLGEAETLLHRAYDQATTDGDHGLASTTAGDLMTLLRDQGRLGEALTLADQKIEHTSRAGFGFWTQLSDQGRRLQILNLLGHHEQVLNDLPALRAQMAELPDQAAHNDRVNPWNAREGVLNLGRTSAAALQRWNEALNLNDEIARTQTRRGANPDEIASTRFNDYLPLLHLGRIIDADHLLRDCQDVFDTAGDVTQLAAVYAARADLENTRDHPGGGR
jgi:MEDS: MEthanogen/methylotroph, DcmR Sensory domain